MKDKIAEVIKKKDFHYEYDDPRDLAQAIVDLIAKELPKEKEMSDYAPNGSDEKARNNQSNMSGFNQCLKDIKHKLGNKTA